MAMVAPLVPRLYRTSDHVRNLAAVFLRTYALEMPMAAFCICAYFTLRSGGKTFITFLFDSGNIWLISVPLAWYLVHLTTLSVTVIYLCVLMADIIKCLFGIALLRRGKWLNNMVA